MSGSDLLVERMDTTGLLPFPNLSSDIGSHFASMHIAGLPEHLQHHSGDVSYALSHDAHMAPDIVSYNARLDNKLREAKKALAKSESPTGISMEIPLDLQVKRLLARVRGADEARLGQFLRTKPHFLPLVDESLRRIRSHFPDATMFLAVEDDPDTPATEYLVCYIRTEQTVEEAEAAYDKFRDEWWLDAKRLADDCFTICVEYQ